MNESNLKDLTDDELLTLIAELELARDRAESLLLERRRAGRNP